MKYTIHLEEKLIKISDIFQILFGLLNAIQVFLIAGNSLNDFEHYLSKTFDNIQHQIVFDLITKQKIDVRVTSLQIYNEQQYRILFRVQLNDFFPKDFKQFLVSYNLTPCQKKKCKSRPICHIEGQEEEQYFCLICYKKMCSYNCGQPSKAQGNLTRHAIKKHQCQTIYLQISSSKIIIMVAPQYIIQDQTLYQNLINEQPVQGPYESKYYEKFLLNQKVIDIIVDIIIGKKYLQRMHANMSKIEIKQI